MHISETLATLYHSLTSIYEENTVARSKHPCICIDVWIRILLAFSFFLYYTLEYEEDPQATEVYDQDQDPATFEPVPGKQPLWVY